MAHVLRSHEAPAGQWTSVPISLATMPSNNSEELAPLEPDNNAHETTGLPLKEPEEWISTALRAWSVILFIAMAISLIIAIIVLLLVSLRNDGFVTVGAALVAYGATWRLSLLWTAFPSFLFTLLGLHWAAIAGAAADRQPFVGLNRPGGGLAKETVLLDYRSNISLTRWCAAFRNKHWVVGLAQLVALVFSVLSPLAASLFVATSALFNREVPVAFNSSFDQNALNTSMDIRVLLDTVTATLIYGADAHPWTDQEHAFRPFYTEFQLAGGPPPTNATSLTAPTVAHSGYVNCAVLASDTDYDITVKSQASSPQRSADLMMTGNDRGCSIRQEFTVSDLQSVYFVTTSEISCSVAALYSRLVFTYGHWSATGPSFMANVSVVSCAVGYRKTNGQLGVTMPSSGAADGKVLRFNPTQDPQDSRDDAFGFWPVFETKLFQSSAFSVDTAWSTTDFGSVVLYRAMQRQGGGARSSDNATVLGGKVLAASVADVFTSTYLTGMATVGLVPTAGGGREETTARIVTRLTRLFVVPWVAGTVIGVLAFITVVAALVLTHTWRHRTLLYEEPAGLLANAGLLQGSELIEVARRVRDSERFDGKVVANVMKDSEKEGNKEGEGDLVRERWKMSVREGIAKPRIVIADGWESPPAMSGTSDS